MSVWRLVAREIVHRRGSFILGVICVAAATGTLLAGGSFLTAHDIETNAILDAASTRLDARLRVLDDRMRRAMLRLGFNITILPEGQDLGDWHADDYASGSMPENSVERLARGEPVRSAHFVAALRKKITWPEKQWTVIVLGLGNRIHHPHAEARELEVTTVPRGEMHLGFEIHQGLGLRVWDDVALMGKRFKVGRCVEERGGPEDVTIRLNLADAQELLGREGEINEVYAVATPEGLRDIPALRAEIRGILPGVQVIEQSAGVRAAVRVRTKVMEEGQATMLLLERERAQLRKQTRRLVTAVGVPIVVLCGVWIVLSAFGNARDRLNEIGILRAMGYRTRTVTGLCLLRFCLMGLVGGLIGALPCVSGDTLSPAILVVPVFVAAGASCLAGWMPVAMAVRRDPAAILRE